MDQWVFETSEGDFEREVVERSKTVPVVVDFWAPWCAPCRTLGPLLERLAAEHGGAFVVAKVNVDQNAQLAAAFGARSIPLVLGLRDGKVVAEFVGALPEAGVREFLSRLLPSQAELAAREGDELCARGEGEQGELAFRRALDLDPRCDRALLGLARILSERGESDDALALLDRVGPGAERPEADQLAATIRVGQTGDVDEHALRARLAANPDDLESRFALAQALGASGRYEQALREYLEVVKRDRAFADEGARKAMLDIFEVVGAGDEMVERYRSELAKVLFS